MPPKPKIGIALGSQEIPSDKEYLEAILQAAGEPVILRPDATEDLSLLHGLVLAGGEDVDPEFYQEKKEPFCEEIDRKRDEFEFQLLRYFLPQSKPVLAICRGIQVLNVALGGTLYQDLQHQFERELLKPHLDRNRLSKEEKRALRHPVTVQPGTKLSQILGERFDVNSRHHQAIKQLAPTLKLTAQSLDGVVEGVESTNHDWVLGVEWHPESSEVRSQFAPLFQAFVSQCKTKKA